MCSGGKDICSGFRGGGLRLGHCLGGDRILIGCGECNINLADGEFISVSQFIKIGELMYGCCSLFSYSSSFSSSGLILHLTRKRMTSYVQSACFSPASTLFRPALIELSSDLIPPYPVRSMTVMVATISSLANRLEGLDSSWGRSCSTVRSDIPFMASEEEDTLE